MLVEPFICLLAKDFHKFFSSQYPNWAVWLGLLPAVNNAVICATAFYLFMILGSVSHLTIFDHAIKFFKILFIKIVCVDGHFQAGFGFNDFQWF